MPNLHQNKELLSLYDDAFIEQVYLYALQRKPDPKGKANFLQKLRTGKMNKREILYTLQNSEEGRKICSSNKKDILLHKIDSLPIIGYMTTRIRLFFTMPQYIKEIEQHLHALTYQSHQTLLQGKISHGDFITFRNQLNTLQFNEDKTLKNKHILLCSNAYPPNFIGGAELIAHYQAKALQKQGYTVKVFAGDFHIDTEHYALTKEVFEDIEVYRVKLDPSDFAGGSINFRQEQIESHFRHILESFSPSVVHMHNIIGLSVALGSITKQYAIKTVMTLHDGWGFCYRNTMMRDNNVLCHNFSECNTCMPFIHQEHFGKIPISFRQDYFTLALRHIDLFISPSQYLKEQYVHAGFKYDDIEVLANGIDVKKFDFPSIKSDKIRFTSIGYLGEHKGTKMILQALTLLKNKQQIHVKIIGEGALEDELKAYIEAHHLTPYVEMLGKLPNHEIPHVFSQTDVYILPSKWPENQPVSITEAFASKVAVIGTDLGGIKELVTHEHTGLLFPMGDVKALAAQMDYFIKNPSKIKEFGRNAFTFIQDKTFDHQVKTLLRYYQIPLVQTIKQKPYIVACVGTHISEISIQKITALKSNYTISIVLHQWLINPYECDIIYVTNETNVENLLNQYAYLEKPYLVNLKITDNLNTSVHIYTEMDELLRCQNL